MRARPLLLFAVLAAPALAAAAQAPQAPDEEGLLFGVRAAWARPFGDIEPGKPLADLADGKLPLWIELGYRFGGHVRASAYFELAPVSLAEKCPAGTACSSFDGRFGLVLHVHPWPRSWLDPWLGAGFGVEHLQATAPPPGGTIATDDSWLGLEVPVEAGFDLAVSDLFTLGPYATVSFAQFTSASSHPPGAPTTSGAVAERATHAWAQVGLKATFKL
jgi:ABC-type amino acid transport substrate-binding protein